MEQKLSYRKFELSIDQVQKLIPIFKQPVVFASQTDHDNAVCLMVNSAIKFAYQSRFTDDHQSVVVYVSGPDSKLKSGLKSLGLTLADTTELEGATSD